MDSKTMDYALWRYGIISPLLHREASEHTLFEMLDDVSSKSYLHPGGERIRASPETIRKWLYRYQQGGLDALADKTRADKGRHRVPAAIQNAMIQLRNEHPRWTLALVMEALIEQQIWNGCDPSRSMLYRFAKANRLRRNDYVEPVTDCRPFAFDKFAQLWVADFLHGPKLWNGKKKVKAYLHLIIDDATRYVVSARFYTSESVKNVIASMMQAVRRFGLPRRFYTDNGAAYASRHLKIVCARTGIHFYKSPPYRPQGRAKVERYFRTVRDQFLEKTRFTSLDHINQELIKYLSVYHNNIHSTLGCSPLEKRTRSESVAREVPETMDIEALFRMERRCRVYNDGTIRLQRKVFEVPGCLPNSRVTVTYLPWDLNPVYYDNGLKTAIPVDLLANANRFEHPCSSKSKKEQP